MENSYINFLPVNYGSGYDSQTTTYQSSRTFSLTGWPIPMGPGSQTYTGSHHIIITTPANAFDLLLLHTSFGIPGNADFRSSMKFDSIEILFLISHLSSSAFSA